MKYKWERKITRRKLGFGEAEVYRMAHTYGPIAVVLEPGIIKAHDSYWVVWRDNGRHVAGTQGAFFDNLRAAKSFARKVVFIYDSAGGSETSKHRADARRLHQPGIWAYVGGALGEHGAKSENPGGQVATYRPPGVRTS